MGKLHIIKLLEQNQDNESIIFEMFINIYCTWISSIPKFASTYLIFIIFQDLILKKSINYQNYVHSLSVDSVWPYFNVLKPIQPLDRFLIFPLLVPFNGKHSSAIFALTFV